MSLIQCCHMLNLVIAQFQKISTTSPTEDQRKFQGEGEGEFHTH